MPTAEPQFPFGFGLSYTRFAYDEHRRRRRRSGRRTAAGTGDGDATAGSVDADEVVQLYLSAANPAAGDPLYTLVGFSRVPLAAGATQTVAFTLTGEELGTVDDDGRLAVRPGAYRLTAGGSSPGAGSVALGAAVPQVWDFAIG